MKVYPFKRDRGLRGQKNQLAVIGLILILLATTLLLFFFLRGETKVMGEWNGIKSTETATCESDSVVYPMFTYNNTNKRSLKVITTFADGVLDNISLTYKLIYNDSNIAKQSSAENQAAMNISFGKDSLGAFAFDAKYSSVNGISQMTLYAKSKDLSIVALKYFMLDRLDDVKTYNKESVVRTLSHRGLNCVYKEIINKESNEDKL